MNELIDRGRVYHVFPDDLCAPMRPVVALERTVVREVGIHLCGCLGAGCELEGDVKPVDGDGLVLADFIGGRHERQSVAQWQWPCIKRKKMQFHFNY